jgi:hypothetical protein
MPAFVSAIAKPHSLWPAATAILLCIAFYAALGTSFYAFLSAPREKVTGEPILPFFTSELLSAVAAYAALRLVFRLFASADQAILFRRFAVAVSVLWIVVWAWHTLGGEWQSSASGATNFLALLAGAQIARLVTAPRAFSPE